MQKQHFSWQVKAIIVSTVKKKLTQIQFPTCISKKWANSDLHVWTRNSTRYLNIEEKWVKAVKDLKKLLIGVLCSVR